MPGLTADQRSRYLEDGYLALKALLPPTDLQPLIDDIAQGIDAKARQAHAEGRLKALFDHEPFDRRLACLREAMDDPSEIERTVTGKRLRTAGLFSVITHPAILDVVESVIGPEIMFHPQFNCQAKMPGENRSKIPWHQDLGFLRPEAEGTFMVNFWIPLVDATVENGCLEVIAGSHRSGLKPHGPLPDHPEHGILTEHLPPGDRLACPVRKGGAVLFQHKTAHRSFPNRTDRIRWSIDIRYSDPAMPTGRDEIPGLLVRSRTRPASVLRSHLDWRKLWEKLDPDQY